jgi:hypothetical protein
MLRLARGCGDRCNQHSKGCQAITFRSLKGGADEGATDKG